MQFQRGAQAQRVQAPAPVAVFKVPVGRCHPGLEVVHVHTHLRLRMQPNGVALHLQKHGCAGRFTQCLAQVRKRLPQVVQRHFIGLVGPQQPGQVLPGMSAVAFHRQVGQQRAGFVGVEAADGTPVHAGFKIAETGDVQCWHGVPFGLIIGIMSSLVTVF